MSDSKRIAKNTIFLYLRMIVVMIVSLYTSRVVLNILGETDYGIYNIVGGVVVMAAFVNNAMSAATQRYMSYSLGKSDGCIGHILGCSIYSYLIIAGIILFIAETIGLWFVNTQLSIPQNRMFATNVVYQLSILTFLVNIMRIPFEALIISHERMSFYAYLTMAETIMKLLVVYMLIIVEVDKLIGYAMLMLLVPVVNNIIYQLFCRKKLGYRVKVNKDIVLIKELFSYSGWSMIGSAANIFARQGGNILINIFFGVVYNAAFGLASKVNSAVSSLISSFQVAFRPQIVKLYASSKMEDVYHLCFRAAAFSYYILLIIIIPISFNINYVLKVWLGEVPPYTAAFCILLLIYSLIDAIQSPLTYLITATGRIRVYEIWLSSLLILNLPISYMLLKFGLPVVIVLVVYVLLNLISAIIRTIYIKNFMNFPSYKYVIKVVFPATGVTILCIVISYVVYTIIPEYIIGFMKMAVSASIIFTICCAVVYAIGFSKEERRVVQHRIRQIIYHSK